MGTSGATPTGRRPRRLLILPVEVAGYGSRVAEGFREIGWTVDVLDLSGNPMAYPEAPATEPLVAELNRASALARSGPRSQARWLRARSLPLRVRTALLAAPNYDAVMYLYGRSLLGRLDLWLVRRSGGRSVAVFLGSDARPPYLSGHLTNTGRPIPLARTLLRTLLAVSRVRKMEKGADVVICHPAYGHFFNAPFVNWLAIGMPGPRERPSAKEAAATVPNSPIRLLHAPSVSRQKGTGEFKMAVETLQRGGLAVELELLSGASNAEVLTAICRTDAVLDQMYSDTPFASLASEAAASGLPVLTFGYASDMARRYSERLGIPTKHFLAPEEVLPAIERLVREPSWRQALADETHEYVATESQPATVARRIERLIDDDVPHEWSVDPGEVDYCEGWGAPREATRSAVRRYVGRVGVRALMLRRGSSARAAILDFVSQTPPSVSKSSAKS